MPVNDGEDAEVNADRDPNPNTSDRQHTADTCRKPGSFIKRMEHVLNGNIIQSTTYVFIFCISRIVTIDCSPYLFRVQYDI